MAQVRGIPLLATLALAALPWGLGASPARAAYLLGTGDVVEVSVLGVADYRRRVTVNVDGDVSLPIVGEVPANGLTLGELRKRITAQMAQSQTLRSPDVTVELVEYRPFYVTGDVSRPGAVPYRPGLTARVAVALAGGYDALRFRAENPLLTGPDLRSQYESSWMDLIRRQARGLCLQAEGEGKDVADLKILDEAPVAKASIRSVADVEARDLKVRMADYAKQRQHLDRIQAQAQANVATLEASLQQQSAAVARQAEAAERLQGSFARGVSPVMRLEEENRAMATLRGQVQDTTSRLATARREREEASRAIERFSDERKHRLLVETQDAFVEVERLRSQVRAAGEKLLYTGAVKAQMKRGGKGPEMVVHRKAEGRTVSLDVGEGDDILPGDVLDVIIRPDLQVLSPSQ